MKPLDRELVPRHPWGQQLELLELFPRHRRGQQLELLDPRQPLNPQLLQPPQLYRQLPSGALPSETLSFTVMQKRSRGL